MFGMGMSFDLYVLEQEGVFNNNKRKEKIDNAIAEFKTIKNAGDLSNDDINPVLNKYGLTEEELTDKECQYIQQAVIGLN
jgi:hypothetical protein